MRVTKVTYYGHYNRIPPDMPLRAVVSHELTFLISGDMTYKVAGKEIRLSDGDAVFVPGGVKRSRAPGERCDYVSFNFLGEPPELPDCIKGAVRSELMMLIGALDIIREKQGLSEDGKVEYILEAIIGILSDNLLVGGRSELTVKILEYLNEHKCERITLADIGRVTFFSPVWCDTVFKREIGKSIIDYLIDMRIEEAKRLIIEGALTLSEISERLGFSDYNYFSRVFKGRVGYSPRAFRYTVK